PLSGLQRTGYRSCHWRGRRRSSAGSTAFENCVYVSFYPDRPNTGLSSSRLWRNGKVSSDDRDNLSLSLKPAVAVRDWPGHLFLFIGRLGSRPSQSGAPIRDWLLRRSTPFDWERRLPSRR